MEVSVQINAPAALSPVKDHDIHSSGGWEDIRHGLDKEAKRKQSLLPTGP
jgi:hypothetical protein